MDIKKFHGGSDPPPFFKWGVRIFFMGGQEAEIWGQSFLTPLTPWGKTLIYCDVICYSQVPNERGGGEKQRERLMDVLKEFS